MKSLRKTFEELMLEYDEDLSSAKIMRIYDEILKNGFGKRISVLESGAGPSRIWKSLYEKIPFIQVTAFKGCTLTHRENIKRNSQMVQIIRNKGLGATHMLGAEYCKFLPSGEPEPSSFVEEISFFIPFKETKQIKNKEDLKQLGVDLCRQFDQWGFIYGDGEFFHLVKNDGTPEKTMKKYNFDVAVLDAWWSKIKGRKFRFECVVWPDGPLQGRLLSEVFVGSK